MHVQDRIKKAGEQVHAEFEAEIKRCAERGCCVSRRPSLP